MPRGCADCQTSFFDLFGIYANPAGAYWNLVEGGEGTLQDPLTDRLELGYLWSFGGQLGAGVAPGDGPQRLEGPVSTSFPTNGETLHLSLVLDTRTAPDTDHHYASWGEIRDIRVVPETADGLSVPYAPAWQISDFDPDEGTAFDSDTGGTDLLLATQQTGAPDGVDAQPAGIWGVSGILPAVDPATRDAVVRWHLTAEVDVATWDTYAVGTSTAIRAPELSPVVFGIVVLAMVVLVWRRELA